MYFLKWHYAMHPPYNHVKFLDSEFYLNCNVRTRRLPPREDKS